MRGRTYLEWLQNSTLDAGNVDTLALGLHEDRSTSTRDGPRTMSPKLHALSLFVRYLVFEVHDSTQESRVPASPGIFASSKCCVKSRRVPKLKPTV